MEWLYHLGVPEDQIEDLATQQRQHRPCYDAVYHRVLHAACQRATARTLYRTAP